jgi:hypothetical protein
MWLATFWIRLEAVLARDRWTVGGADLGTSSKESYWDFLQFFDVLPRMTEAEKGSTKQLIAMWVSQS